MSLIRSFFKNYNILINRLFREINNNFNKTYPELCYAVDVCNRDINSQAKPANSLSILDSIIGNGFLWAVPKHRRSLERRMTRRMGFGKMLIPKNNLVVCDTCGHFHPVHCICGNCYEKVKQETDIMQEAIQKELKLDPIDREVVIVYEDDPKDRKEFDGYRIVEIEKERPQWFSKNLLAKDSGLRRQKPKSIGEAQLQPTVTDDK